MNDPNEPLLTTACDAIQWEISQALDERRALPENVSLHLGTCPGCANFVLLWRENAGPAAALVIKPSLDPAFSQRVLDGTLRGSASPSRTAAFFSQVSRWAAVFAFVALAWWLLDPHDGKPRQRAQPRMQLAQLASPSVSLDRQIARIEQVGDQERVVLRQAMVDGTARFRDIIDWSSGVLE